LKWISGAGGGVHVLEDKLLKSTTGVLTLLLHFNCMPCSSSVIQRETSSGTHVPDVFLNVFSGL
jgi:hypothetical protein